MMAKWARVNFSFAQVPSLATWPRLGLGRGLFGRSRPIRRVVPDLVVCEAACSVWIGARSTQDATRRFERGPGTILIYFARLNTKSSVIPAGVRGFVNFNSSALMDVTIRR
jgi:hypothetical protein